MPIDGLTACLAAAAAVFLGATLVAAHLASFAAMQRAPRAAGLECPRCRRGTLERVANLADGTRFYLCDRCAGRWRRSMRDGPWEDASAPSHARAFVRARARGGSAKPSTALSEEACWTITLGTLVRSKRSRSGGPSRKHDKDGGAEAGPGPSLWDREFDGGC